MPHPPLLPYQQLMAQALAFSASYEQIKRRFADFADHAGELSKQGPVPDGQLKRMKNSRNSTPFTSVGGSASN